MESKAYYIKSILKTLGAAAVAMLVATMLFKAYPPEDGSQFMMTLLCAGIPFGWSAVQRALAGIVTWGFYGILIRYLLMLLAAVTIGWIILGYRLIKDTVQLLIVLRMERSAAAA